MNRNSANRVILVGHLGGNAETRHLSNETITSNFSIATNISWKNENGEYSERTDWHRITAWRNLAEYTKSLIKGQLLYVEGHLQNREWTDKDNQKHYVTDIIAEKITALGTKKKEPSSQDNSDNKE
ncbi:MAG: single-stranded DNA-binding protein [Candidatus Marinimicrobia bacterium]|nr:single-stranded DNA-binding protein [Candidatus Neomarinimicrobiota bacterium]